MSENEEINQQKVQKATLISLDLPILRLGDRLFQFFWNCKGAIVRLLA
ncbi:MAG: hypothetical protein KME40_21610 [Komarekiella atlantica HA4396-MV6]|nr:hypothetical protein [Komarekiella atlantica HA4396-MV6]